VREGIAAWLFVLAGIAAFAQFRIEPYLQLSAPDSVAIVWWSSEDVPGTLEWGVSLYRELTTSQPRPAEAITTVIGGTEDRSSHPFRHEVRLTGLSPDTTYRYRVRQGNSQREAQFTTAPGLETDFTFVVAADPESKGTEPIRSAIHRSVLGLALTKNPRFLVYAGDLVDQGNAQDDWDAFWSDVVGPTSPASLASYLPIFPALGNHEYDALNTTLGGNSSPFTQPFAEEGLSKYRAYFSLPGNDHPADDPRSERYYAVRYGPISLIVLDTNNDSISSDDPRTNWDTGRYSGHPLAGENEPPEPGGKGWAPDIHGGRRGRPWSRQFRWLARELERARRESAFVFVVNHQAPYSSFVHGDPDEQQSGHPLRKLDPLFHRYRVDAVFSGHDEAYEHSVTMGPRDRQTGLRHELHYFLLTTAGDPTGLRTPEPDPVWQEGFSRFLYPLDNRRHGYLAVAIEPLGGGEYRATVTPFYLDPNAPTNPGLFYDDVTVLRGALPLARWD
jgi:hypothetical protein